MADVDVDVDVPKSNKAFVPLGRLSFHPTNYAALLTGPRE
jgi:hypothetical protein